MAVEINKSLCEIARENFVMNDIKNAIVLSTPSENFALNLLRKKNLSVTIQSLDSDREAYDFGAVLVDPPRSGLDEHTVQAIAGYNVIMYISCNPVSLVRDLKKVYYAATVQMLIYRKTASFTNLQ